MAEYRSGGLRARVTRPLHLLLVASRQQLQDAAGDAKEAEPMKVVGQRQVA